jgi:hypothetical protein
VVIVAAVAVVVVEADVAAMTAAAVTEVVAAAAAVAVEEAAAEIAVVGRLSRKSKFTSRTDHGPFCCDSSVTVRGRHAFALLCKKMCHSRKQKDNQSPVVSRTALTVL